MNKTILASLLAISAVYFLTSQVELDAQRNEFQEWKAKFNMQYGSQEEETLRFALFQQNYEYIQQENEKYARGEISHYLGLNQFSHLSLEEYSAIIKSQYQKVEPQQQQPQATLKTEIPTAVDWVKNGAVTGVKNQGQCGSCWAFGTIGACEGLNFIQNQKLESFSEQQLLDCSASYGNNGCGGGEESYSYNYIKDHGITTESQYPYTAVAGTCSYTPSMKAYSVKGYSMVTIDNNTDFITALSAQPINIVIWADSPSFMNYAGGVLKYYVANCPGKNYIDHATLAVAYDADTITVKNSYGASWGESGYYRIEQTTMPGGVLCAYLKPMHPI